MKRGGKMPRGIKTLYNIVMQHREIITSKLERAEGGISQLESLLSRGGDVQSFKQILNQLKDLIQDTKDYIQREPRTPNEY
jgi:5-bromo-4-chloroindolyl phosphate hydrolysis protein